MPRTVINFLVAFQTQHHPLVAIADVVLKANTGFIDDVQVKELFGLETIEQDYTFWIRGSEVERYDTMGRWSPLWECDYAIFIDKCCCVADVTCKKATQ